MNDKERFQYEMMNTVDLANACQKVKVKIDKLVDEKIMANHQCEWAKLDKLTIDIRQAKINLREMRKILKTRQLKLF